MCLKLNKSYILKIYIDIYTNSKINVFLCIALYQEARGLGINIGIIELPPETLTRYKHYKREKYICLQTALIDGSTKITVLKKAS